MVVAAAEAEENNDIREFERRFNERFQEPCGTCKLVECHCDEETMELMDREMRDREQECAE